MTERKKLLEWDVLNIAEQQAQCLAEDNEFPDLDEDELLTEALEDTDLFTQEWDWLCDYLTELMQKCNSDGHWYIVGHDLGWRNLHGWQKCQALTGKELLEATLPKTDCTFIIYDDAGGGFAINNFHHDSPTGEWYYVYPDNEYCHCCNRGHVELSPCSEGCEEMLCQDCAPPFGGHICDLGDK